MTGHYIHEIKDRPKITTELPEEFQGILSQFNKFVMSKTVATQQVISDMRSDQPPFESSQPIQENIQEILDLTDGGRELAYDESTQQAIFDSDDFASSVKDFRKLAKDDARVGQSRQNIALLGLSIYAERAVQYKHQRKPKYRSA